MTHSPLPTAADWMQQRLVTVAPDAPIEEAVRLLLSKGHAAAPVVDRDGKLLGIVSEHDCARGPRRTTYELLDERHRKLD